MAQYMTTLGAYSDHFLQVLGPVKPSPLPLTSKVQTTRYASPNVCEYHIGSINIKKQQTKALQAAERIPKIYKSLNFSDSLPKNILRLSKIICPVLALVILSQYPCLFQYKMLY